MPVEANESHSLRKPKISSDSFHPVVEKVLTHLNNLAETHQVDPIRMAMQRLCLYDPHLWAMKNLGNIREHLTPEEVAPIVDALREHTFSRDDIHELAYSVMSILAIREFSKGK